MDTSNCKISGSGIITMESNMSTHILPPYWDCPCCDSSVVLAAVGHSGSAYGVFAEDMKSITIHCDQPGKYRMTVMGFCKNEHDCNED